MLFDYKKYLLAVLPVLLVTSVYTMEDSKDLNHKLFKAVIVENIDKVNTLVKLGADVNATKCFLGQTPLFYAKSANMVNCLVHHKADVNTTKRFETPLLHAVKVHPVRRPGNRNKENMIGVIDCLIQHGADINHSDINNLSPLKCSVAHKRIELTKYLCNAGASLVFRDSTAFHFAALSSSKKLIKILITCARFDSSEEILCQQTENEQEIREKLKIVFFLCNRYNTPIDIKCLILSKLPLRYLQGNGRSPKKLVGLGYKQHILMQVYDRVARLQEILQIKTSDNKTPLQFLIQRYQDNPQQYATDLNFTHLFDGSLLKKHLAEFCEVFPDKSPLSPHNLVYQMYHSPEELIEKEKG